MKKRKFIFEASNTKLTSLVPKEIRAVHELKRIIPVNEWNVIRTSLNELLGLTEAEAVTDDQLANLIQQAAKELNLPAAKDIKDIEIDQDAMEKGQEDAIELKKESKQTINEGLTMALILGAPTILKLLANVIDWVYRAFALSDDEKKQYKEDSAAYAYAKKTGKTPDGKVVDDHDLHDMEDKLFKSKAAKLVLKASHGLHTLYVKPLRALIAGILWVGGDPGSEQGGKGEGLSMVNAWKRAKKPAEIIYAVIMIGIAGYGAVQAISSIPSAVEAVKSIGGIQNLATVVLDATKGGDMSDTIIKGILKHVHI